MSKFWTCLCVCVFSSQIYCMPHLSTECHLLNGSQLPFPWVYSSYPSFFPLLSVPLFCPLVCHLTAALNCTISHVTPVHPGQELMACPKLGLSFPHYPEPCHQKASTFLQVQLHPTWERESHIWVIVGPLMDRILVVPRVRERKRLMSPGFRGKPVESCSQGSHCCMWAPGALSRGEGAVRLLERVLETRAGK